MNTTVEYTHEASEWEIDDGQPRGHNLQVSVLGGYSLDRVDNVVSSSRENVDDAEEDDRTFDPRAPRSNYSLYPLEYLMYCEDCHQIRCPRCVSEEIVTYYCPNCLFEVPSSNLKSEGNRSVSPSLTGRFFLLMT